PYAGDLRGTVWDDAWAAKTPTRFYIYNSRAFLDRPGEFFMDLESKRLYYRPRKLPIEKQTILAPAVTRLISVENASNLEFRGLAFAVSDGLLDVAPTLPLHANIKGGLIHLRNASRIAIRDCRLSQSGQNGIVVEGGVRDTTISGNEITATASGGIRFVGGDNRGMLIENNYLHHLGDGIHIFGSRDDAIRHNRIDHVGSNGIKSLRSQRQRIEYNDVSRIGLEGTDSDSAGIYVNVTAGGRDGGHITIDHNRIHDLTWNRTPGYPGAAVYLDMDGTYNCTITNNIIYNLRHKFAIHLRGAHHVVRNNIVHLEGPDLLEPFTLITGYKAANVAVDAPPIHHYDYTIERNVVWCSRKRMFRIRGKVASDTFRSVDHNVYFTPAGEYVFQKMTLEQWQGKGLDRHSRFADPRFVDRHRHDYRLEPDSPARELGFQPIDESRIGLIEDFVYEEKPRRVEGP
ncbi:MAG TPA: hypothetical protein ENJ16_02925, partial [Planctomycetaceae bacterium]|nr:hypothetical protein [Planctomycetaceae bacterium]